MNDESNPTEDSPDEFLFVWACGFELAIGLVGLLVAWVAGIDARAYLGKIEDLHWQSVGFQFLAGAAAAIPMLVAIKLLMKVPHKSIDAIKELSEVPTMQALLALPTLELITLSICAGIGEELAFRGVLLPLLTSLRDATATIPNSFDVGDSFHTAVPAILTSAIVLSSVAFGLLHPITRLYVAVASLMGVYFAALLILTDSLLIPIVAHAVYDAAQFISAKREMKAEAIAASD